MNSSGTEHVAVVTFERKLPTKCGDASVKIGATSCWSYGPIWRTGSTIYTIGRTPDSRWFGEVCKCIQWHRTFQYRSKGEPINRGELRGVRTAVRRLLRSGQFGVRQIIGIDSKVVEGIIAKGRSSSRELNILMRGLAADMLVGDIQLGILGLASKHNPADDPSREKRVRKAKPETASAWARRFVAGEVTAIDSVLPPDPRLKWCCSPTSDSARCRGS